MIELFWFLAPPLLLGISIGIIIFITFEVLDLRATVAYLNDELDDMTENCRMLALELEEERGNDLHNVEPLSFARAVMTLPERCSEVYDELEQEYERRYAEGDASDEELEELAARADAVATMFNFWSQVKGEREDMYVGGWWPPESYLKPFDSEPRW